MSDHRRSQNAQQGRTGIDKEGDKLSPPSVDKILDKYVYTFVGVNSDMQEDRLKLKSALKKDIVGLLPEKEKLTKKKSEIEVGTQQYNDFMNGWNHCRDEIKNALEDYFK